MPGVVPEDRLPLLEQVPTWDEWDPDREKYFYDWSAYAPGEGHEGGGGTP